MAGKAKIPPAVQAQTENRILRYANQHHAGMFTRIDVRFRAAFCYIDAYEDPGDPPEEPPDGETREQWVERVRNIPTHLCRLRYLGHPDLWGFDFYTYAHQKYEPNFLLTGEFQGTPEEAFETCAIFR
jgi:hypothetical protein